MEPQIRYAKTHDGVNIAYFTMGVGPPLVIMDLPASNVQYELELPLVRDAYEDVVRGGVSLVRYDHRGFGLSDNWTDEFTTDAFVQDLETVVDRLELSTFFLLAARGSSYPVALEYTKRHPDRVLRMAAVVGGPPWEFVEAILDTPGADWPFMIQTITRRVAGWEDQQAADELAGALGRAIDLDGLRRFIRWCKEARVPEGLAEINTTCLLLPYRLNGYDWVNEARGLAAQMPDVALQPITGESGSERYARSSAAITAFFTAHFARPRPPSQPTPRTSSSATSAVILFIDIAESTALTERLGDMQFREMSRSLELALRAKIREGGGAAVEGKVMGDGVMATFASAREAIAAAIRCNELSAESELRLHLGIHAGDVIREPGNVYGGAVNIAARICDASTPGEILVSDVVRGMARTSAGVAFEDRGEHTLKGIAEPLRVFAIRSA
jgi:class 3 adenylate cyclase